MFGETGLGKTHLSRAIAGVVAEKGYNVVCVRRRICCAGLRMSIFRRTEDEGTLDRMLKQIC